MQLSCLYLILYSTQSNSSLVVHYLDLNEVENDGHVIGFDVGHVAMTTGFVVLVSDLMSQSVLHVQQNLQPTSSCGNGSDSPHRRRVMPLLRAIGYVRRTIMRINLDKKNSHTPVDCHRPC